MSGLVSSGARVRVGEALDAAGTGAADAMAETFAQLDARLVTPSESAGRP